MRILLVNKTSVLRSGTERYLDILRSELRRRGHEVEVFACAEPDSPPSRFRDDFAKAQDYRRLGVLSAAAAAIEVSWSRSAARSFKSVLESFRPQVVHLFNIYHQLSPSLLQPLREAGIATVQTLNDAQQACANYQFWRGGEPCFDCRDGHYLRILRHRCLHGSVTWSAAAMAAKMLHRRFDLDRRGVARFLVPSTFLLGALGDFDLADERYILFPYPVARDFLEPATTEPGEDLLFIGRLSPEKGVGTLLEAAAQLGAKGSLRVAGDGPERSSLEQRARILGLDVRWLGHLGSEELRRAIDACRVVVVPSRWPEVFGQVVLEAQARSRPVIASAIGGLSELITPGKDGWLTPVGDKDALAEAMGEALGGGPRAATMGQAGRHRAEAHHPDHHLDRLEEIFGQLAEP